MDIYIRVMATKLIVKTGKKTKVYYDGEELTISDTNPLRNSSISSFWKEIDALHHHLTKISTKVIL